jgi:hypothetical protein
MLLRPFGLRNNFWPSLVFCHHTNVLQLIPWGRCSLQNNPWLTCSGQIYQKNKQPQRKSNVVMGQILVQRSNWLDLTFSVSSGVWNLKVMTLSNLCCSEWSRAFSRNSEDFFPLRFTILSTEALRNSWLGNIMSLINS